MGPSVHVFASFFDGYTRGAEACSGVVTKTEGPRKVVQIDHRPAAEVYHEWAENALGKGRAFDLSSAPVQVLGETTAYPLGKRVGTDHEGTPTYQLVHPSRVLKEHS